MHTAIRNPFNATAMLVLSCGRRNFIYLSVVERLSFMGERESAHGDDFQSIVQSIYCTGFHLIHSAFCSAPNSAFRKTTNTFASTKQAKSIVCLVHGEMHRIRSDDCIASHPPWHSSTPIDMAERIKYRRFAADLFIFLDWNKRLCVAFWKWRWWLATVARVTISPGHKATIFGRANRFSVLFSGQEAPTASFPS